jgi:hypothetical protein
MGSSLVFEGYRDGKHALFVWNPDTNAYEPVTLTGAGSNYLQNYGEQGVSGDLSGTQSENYISGPDLLVYNGDVYLEAQATDGNTGLFVYDTFNGTSSQIQINSGQSQNRPVDLVEYGGQIYFDNYAVPPGSLAGAVGALYEVVHENTGTLVANEVRNAPSNPSSMVVFNNDLFMDGTDKNGNNDLWSYNANNFTMINGTTGLNPTDLTVAGPDLVFNGLDSSGNNALYEYYKSSNGSYVLDKVDAGSSSYSDAQGNHGRDPLDITYAGVTNNINQSVVYYSGVTDKSGDRGLFFANVGPYTTAEQIGDLNGSAPKNLDPYDLTLDARGDLFFTGNDGLGGRGLYEAAPGGFGYHEVLASNQYNFGATGAPYNDNWGNLNPNTLAYVLAGNDTGTLYFAATGPGTNNQTQLWEASVSASGQLGAPHQAGASTGGLNPFSFAQ